MLQENLFREFSCKRFHEIVLLTFSFKESPADTREVKK